MNPALGTVLTRELCSASPGCVLTQAGAPHTVARRALEQALLLSLLSCPWLRSVQSSGKPEEAKMPKPDWSSEVPRALDYKERLRVIVPEGSQLGLALSGQGGTGPGQPGAPGGRLALGGEWT